MPVLDFGLALLLHGDLAPGASGCVSAPDRLVDELGIRRTSVLREHRGITSGTLRAMRISLSKGDGSNGWTCDLPPLPPAWACRSPHGRFEHHVSGSVYCRRHRKLYCAQQQPKSARTGRKLPPGSTGPRG